MAGDWRDGVKRLDQLRAALWRAIALTLAEPMVREERQRVIEVGKTVDQQLFLSAQLFGDETEENRSGEADDEH